MSFLLVALVRRAAARAGVRSPPLRPPPRAPLRLPAGPGGDVCGQAAARIFRQAGRGGGAAHAAQFRGPDVAAPGAQRISAGGRPLPHSAPARPGRQQPAAPATITLPKRCVAQQGLGRSAAGGRARSPQLTPAAPPHLQVPCPSVTQPASKTLSIVMPAYNEQDRLPGTLDETIRWAQPHTASARRHGRPMRQHARARAAPSTPPRGARPHLPSTPAAPRPMPPAWSPPCSYLQRRRNKAGPSFTYEIIVVDDGSSDDTARVTYDYVRRHGIDAIRLLRLPQNRGKVRSTCAAPRGPRPPRRLAAGRVHAFCGVTRRTEPCLQGRAAAQPPLPAASAGHGRAGGHDDQPRGAVPDDGRGRRDARQRPGGAGKGAEREADAE